MLPMIPMFQSLWAHLTWADTSILEAVGGQENAPTDEDIRKWLHHIVTVEQFFLSLFQQRPFDMERFKQAGNMEDRAACKLSLYDCRLETGHLCCPRRITENRFAKTTLGHRL